MSHRFLWTAASVQINRKYLAELLLLVAARYKADDHEQEQTSSTISCNQAVFHPEG